LPFQVVALDGIPERRQQAAKFGATSVAPEEAAAAVAAITGGRGADVVLEVVGAPSALDLAFQLLRAGGTLSSVGVHTSATFPFSPVDAYNKNLTFKSGRCPARAYMQKLLPLVQQKAYPFTDIITHRMPLREGAHGYQLFDKKLEGCVKVVLDPWL
jgi:threonine dehydrogenase-like Zn-dependent dehydrogenase